jgi:septum formation inhibitor MinC
MKSLPFLVATGASAVSLLLGIWLFFLGNTNQGLQSDIQKLQQEVQTQQGVLQVKQQQLQVQQEQINTANTISQQVGPALLRDMAVASIKNDKIKKILSAHGYSVEQKDEKAAPPAAGAATPAPAPATPAIPAATRPATPNP